MDKPKISVAMAVFNGGSYLDAQLESLFQQTWPPDEIVICDDGSLDNSPNIIMHWQESHPDVIIYHKNPQQLGVTRNFEKAISLCTGEIIFLADQDDVWLPAKIKTLAEKIMAAHQPSGAFCDSLLVDQELQPLGRTHWENRGFKRSRLICELSGSHLDRVSAFLVRVPPAGHDMAFDARLRDTILPFPDLPECYDSWIGLVLAALDRWQFSGQPLTLFRQHDTNASMSGQSMSWRRKFTEARRSIRNNSFTWNEALYRALLQRYQDINLEVLNRIEDRRQHSETRARMNVSFKRRLPLVWQEFSNRRYFKYGRGWYSIIQDLFLR